MNNNIQKKPFFNKGFLLLFLVFLILPRVFFLSGPLDEPQSWRQGDTAQYAYSFYKDGFNILYPSVSWMGGYKTVILEFPFPELLMALGYKFFGYHLIISRLLTLLFFTVSAIYLYFIIRFFTIRRVAAIATLVYLVLPLSVFYSRAVHVDFFTVFFAHAMTFHLLRFIDKQRIPDYIIALISGILAFLIKAPYVFYFALPICFTAIQKKKWKALFWVISCYILSIIPFFFWRIHAENVNAAAPDWNFIPGYGKFINMGHWYFGSWQMRLNPQNWRIIFDRAVDAVTSKTGAVLCGAGFLVSVTAIIKGAWRQIIPLWLWLFAVFAYIAIFFNLVFIHDYYLIPALAPAAIVIALAVNAPYSMFSKKPIRRAWCISTLLFAVLPLGTFLYAKDHYFSKDLPIIEAGTFIRENTPSDALIIAAADIPYTDCRDPRLLYNTKRTGWALHTRSLSANLVESLKGIGATELAILEPNTDNTIDAYGYPFISKEIVNGKWIVLIADLRKE